MKILSSLPLAAALSLMALTPGTASAPAAVQPELAASSGSARPVQIARRGRGADDGPNHDKTDDHGRRGRGRDDGRRHG